jgi:hypothetical protein
MCDTKQRPSNSRALSPLWRETSVHLESLAANLIANLETAHQVLWHPGHTALMLSSPALSSPYSFLSPYASISVFTCISLPVYLTPVFPLTLCVSVSPPFSLSISWYFDLTPNSPSPCFSSLYTSLPSISYLLPQFSVVSICLQN